MCALGPSLTEAHAGTLLLLRSDRPLYKCTRATALWLSCGGPGAAKRKCPSLQQSSQFRIKTGMGQACLNTNQKKCSFVSTGMSLKETFALIDKTIKPRKILLLSSLFPHLQAFSFFFLFTQPCLLTTFTHSAQTQQPKKKCFYRPLFYYLLNKHYRGSVSLYEGTCLSR